jgi:hypothetical protein
MMGVSTVRLADGYLPHIVDPVKQTLLRLSHNSRALV